MMRFINTLVFCSIFIVLSTKADAKLFNAESFTLQNGLQVVTIPNHRAPVLTHMLWYKAGGGDEPEGKSGITHFLEHLMFKGTDKFPDGTFSNNIKKVGGNDNAFTAHDYTAYYQNIPKEHLELVMTMEADRMRGLTLSEKDIKSERAVVIEERKQRTDNQPQAKFQERLRKALYTKHPYGTPLIGWADEIKTLNRNDALNSYNKWYYPNNAILVVSGDITAKELKPIAEKIYGKLKSSPKKIIRKRPSVPLLEKEKRMTIKDKRIGQPTLIKMYLAPKGNDALNIAAHILGGDATSLLYKKLVVEEKLAIAINIGYEPIKLNNSSLIIYAMPTPSISLKQLEESIDSEINKILEKGFTEETLRKIKNKKEASMSYYLDSLQGPALLFGKYLASGFDIDYIENIKTRLKNLTVEQINTAARNIFLNTNNSPITGFLLPYTDVKEIKK